MKTGFEGPILCSSIKSCIQKICAVSLVREALQVSLPLFWTRPSTKNFYKITQSSSFSATSPEHTKYNLLGQHVVNRPYSRRNINGQRYSNLPSSTTRVCTEFKETSVDTYTENRVLRGDSRFINHDPVSTREETLEISEAVSGTSSGNASADFRINKRIRLIVFNYSTSTSSTNKFQVPTTTTNTSIKIKGVILQKSDSKQKLQGRTAVVDKKFKSLQWSLLDSVSQPRADTDRCIQKGMGCSMSREINRVEMVKGGTFVTHKCIRTESSKISAFHLQQTKYLKAVHFQKDDPTELLYLMKIGETENQMLLKLSKEIWQYLLKHQTTLLQNTFQVL